jgi:membrane-bound ClpP family serine protease
MNGERSGSGNWLFGLIILAIGLIFLLENMAGIELWESIWRLWPIIFLLWGIKELFQRRAIFFGIILLVLGVLLLARNYELYELSESIWKFWPVIIIAIGVDQIFRRPEFVPIKRREKTKKERVVQDDEII